MGVLAGSGAFFLPLAALFTSPVGVGDNEAPKADVKFVASSKLSRSADGLFYLDARVNGVQVRFLVDTGASTVVLTDQDARRAGIVPDRGRPIEWAETPGGPAAMVRVKLGSLETGPVSGRNVEAVVTDSKLGVSLLGQSWLARFESMTVTRDLMVLR
jgi:aspartyl protease family protein